MENRTFKYDFFISYKHGERDSKISGYLQKQLENYKIPKEIQKQCGKEKITRVFRDKEELSVTVDLTLEIEEQLKNTEYLIVMCSPQSKQSVWVNREVETFLKYRGWEYVLPVLIEGEPKDSFPEILNEREMLAADVRGRTFSEIRRKCKNEILRLLAPALRCSYDELRQRNRVYASRRIAVTAIGLAAVAVGFGVYAWKQSVKIQENYWQKLENQAGLLAEKSSELLESGDREAALLVALEGLPEQEASEEKPLVGKAQIALEEALYLYRQPSVTAPRPIHTLKMDNSMKKVYALNEEKDMLVSCDEKNLIYVWDLETGDLKCCYSGLQDADETCQALLGGIENSVYICTDNRVVLFDYETQQTKWEILTDEFAGDSFTYWKSCALSPSKEKLALAGSKKVLIIDTRTGELLDDYPIDWEDWSGQSLVWNPNEEELALPDSMPYESGVILLLDLKTGEERVLKTFEGGVSLDVAYKSEDTLTCVWTDMNNYSLGQFFYYADYYVAEIDCKSGETAWELTEKTVLRDSQPNIRYVCQEDDGELFDLTIVTMGSEVIAIRDGVIWAEFAYDNTVVGQISYGLIEQHITENGVNYLVSLADKFIMNERYDTVELGLEDVYVAAGIKDKGIVAFPGFGGGVLYVYEPVQDENYVELENSAEASDIDYSPNRKYRIAKESGEDYDDGILNIWDLETEEHIFRQEFFYDYDTDTGDYLQKFGFLNDQYFYYSTYYDFVLVDVETLEIFASYQHSGGDQRYLNRIDKLYAVGGEHPGAYFTDNYGVLYFYSVKEQQCRVVLDSKRRNALYAEHYKDASGIYFTANPTGTHLLLTCSPYDEADENKILVWDVSAGKVSGEFKMPFDTHNGFNTDFSKDGMRMLFQKKEQGLQVMDLIDCSVKPIPIAGESFQDFWFSEDERFVFAYTYDYFLRVYDCVEQKQTMNLECEAGNLERWYFHGDNLYMTFTYTMSQPNTFSYRKTGEGVYDCFSVIPNCELIANEKAYVRKDSSNALYCYPHRDLDEMIGLARGILDGRELTDIERQRYSLVE